jgi:YebC/PmpR family DNA-binding regulatory protein
MAGHSQFKNIMHRKGRQDAQKSKLFGKLAREITVAAKLGQPDPGMNARLRAAIISARQENMSKDSIQRAINKASSSDSENYDEIRYEGYGPGGVAVIVEALTDNRNRAASEVRTAMTRNGGNLADPGSVAYLFNRKGVVLVPKNGRSEDDVLLAVLDAGAEEVNDLDDSFEIVCEPTDLPAVRAALKAAGIAYESADISWLASVSVELEDDVARRVLRLVDALEDCDDVQNVWANFDVSDDVLAEA